MMKPMSSRLPPRVDRSFAKMIAYKRLMTGSLAVCAGTAMTVASVLHGGSVTLLEPLALLVFFGGGAWALRDGVRLLKELRT